MKKALMFRGGWEGHQPVETSELVADALRKRGLGVDIFDSQECLLDPLLKTKYRLIVPVWTMGELGNGESKALLEAVRDGIAVGGWHGGAGDSFRQNTGYQYMIGGQWVAHPGGIVDYKVDIVEKDNPVTAGISGFSVHSEQYYMHVDPGNHVIATTTFDGTHDPWIRGTVMPVVWTRSYGAGRVFYSSLGHVAADFKNTPEILEITVRGLLWAADELK